MQEQRALGNILIRHGVVAPEVLEPLYAQQREKGGPLVDLVFERQMASEIDVARALAAECGYSCVERVDVENVPTPVATRLPMAYSRNHKLLVVAEWDDRVEVVCADPLDTDGLDDVRAAFGKPVSVTVCPPSAVVDATSEL
jgi:hypothetical protein